MGLHGMGRGILFGISKRLWRAIFRHGNQFLLGDLMKQCLYVVLGSLMLAPLIVSAQLQSLVSSNTTFALNLYRQLAVNNSGNLFFSPYSISTCLAMLYAGARGNTEAQMSRVLGFSTNQQQLASTFGQLQAALQSDQQTNAIELNIANALWTQAGFPFLPAFLETATNQFQGSISQADFANPVADASAAQTINDWVAQKTSNRIQNLIPSDAITPNTVAVLVNAIYFLGAWTTSFQETNTSTQPFYLSSTNLVDALLMHQPAPSQQVQGYYAGTPPPSSFSPPTFNYMDTNDFQALELPYGTNGTVSMVILLPWQVDGLGRLEQQLSPAFLSSVLAQMKMQNIEIFLPRFIMESSFELTQTLSAMGMPDAFLQFGADFSGIDGAKDLFIGFVYHQAWGQVNEAGTEAAAATAGGVYSNGGAPLWFPPVFRADHPFIFFIRDTQSGSLLFLGRLANPNPSAGPAPNPGLVATPSVNGLTISWPYLSPGWTLEQNVDLTTTNWVPSVAVSKDGTNNYMRITSQPGSLFYRLSLTLGSQTGYWWENR
jgi:serine protease inhibitor